MDFDMGYFAFIDVIIRLLLLQSRTSCFQISEAGKQRGWQESMKLDENAADVILVSVWEMKHNAWTYKMIRHGSSLAPDDSAA